MMVGSKPRSATACPCSPAVEVRRAEPDVGIMSQFVEDLEVTFLSGHPVPCDLSDEDDQRIVNDHLCAYNEPPSDY